MKSAMGTGKSTYLRNLIQRTPKDYSILYVSCRKSFTSKILRELQGFQSYNDENHKD